MTWETELKTKLWAGETTYLKLKVRPNAPKTEIGDYDPDRGLKFAVRAVPEKGKANKEIEKFFRKYLKPIQVDVTIVGGQKGSEKLLRFVLVK